MKISNLESFRERLNKHWDKIKKYVPVALIAFGSMLTNKSEAQTLSSNSSPKGTSSTAVDVGKGTSQDPWKYKLPKAEEDPLFAEINKAKKNPDKIKNALQEMEATIRAKRSKQREGIQEDQLAQFDAHTEELVLSLKTGSFPLDKEYESKASGSLDVAENKN